MPLNKHKAGHIGRHDKRALQPAAIDIGQHTLCLCRRENVADVAPAGGDNRSGAGFDDLECHSVRFLSLAGDPACIGAVGRLQVCKTAKARAASPKASHNSPTIEGALS